MAEALSVALKEWNVACDSLLSGQMSLVLRKGGILEAQNEFELEHKRFLLYPTWIHQNAELLREPWRVGISSQKVEPEQITIKGWAEAAGIWEVGGAGHSIEETMGVLSKLEPWHIWNEAWLKMRVNYRPEKPFYVVLLRAWKLAKPVVMANTPGYAGCKSWVPLESEVVIEGVSEQVMGEGKIREIWDKVTGLVKV